MTINGFPVPEHKFDFCIVHNTNRRFGHTVKQGVEYGGYSMESFQDEGSMIQCIENDDIWGVYWSEDEKGQNVKEVYGPTIEAALRLANSRYPSRKEENS